MSIITINNRPCCRGREIAAEVAAKTGCELVISEQITAMAADQYHVPLEKIKTACESPLSLFGMSLEERHRHLACYEAVLMRYFLRDNILFCGFVGRTLLEGISHILKTYITSNLADRASIRASRKNISDKDAEKQLLKEDISNKKLIKALYNFEDDDPKHYDMTLNIGQITVEDAIEIISMTSKGRRFQPMTYSIASAHNIELMYRVRAALIHIDPNISIRYECSGLIIHSRALESETAKRTAAIKAAIAPIPEAAEADIVITEDFFKQISSTLR
ncbi:MAG: cytidylate kinase-like family protein [Candidatus Magnetominusculus sp. LBB02]|nr:cytidylate kinase-like family protein [Candidatus Magnetominusculus sp. LBB02]